MKKGKGAINSDFISKLYKSRNVLLDILGQRNFNVDDFRNFSINEIHTQYQQQQLDMLFENEETGKKVYIKYHLETKLNPRHVYEYIDDLYHLENILSKGDDLIILSKDKANDTLLNLMTSIYNSEGIFFTIFNIHNLLYNIMDHKLVPPHRILNEEELGDVKKKYNITNIDQFPHISRFDPVAKLLGMRPGQVCEITRPSKTSVITKYYRLCS